MFPRELLSFISEINFIANVTRNAWGPATLLKRDSNTGDICKIFKNTYFEEYLWTTASELTDRFLTDPLTTNNVIYRDSLTLRNLLSDQNLFRFLSLIYIFGITVEIQEI